MTSAPSEWEIWACVHRVRRQHGEKAWLFLADQIGGLLLEGDEIGVRYWRDIEDRLRRLSYGGSLH
jgi:hypothetical protein